MKFVNVEILCVSFFAARAFCETEKHDFKDVAVAEVYSFENGMRFLFQWVGLMAQPMKRTRIAVEEAVKS